MGRDRAATLTLAALVLADLGFAFQQTAIIPAIPSVQHDLHASEAWSAWLLTGYLVAASVATPLLGKIGDRQGRRRALLASLALFLLGSIGAALAPSIAVLIGFRTLQGAGGAIYPLTLSLVRDEVPEGQVGRAVGILTGAFGVGSSLGVGVSGVIVDALSWRWLFACGAGAVAAGIVAVVLAPASEEQRREGSLDLPGTLLLAGGLSLLLVSLTHGTTAGFGSPWVLGGFAASAALLAGWLVVDLRVDDPLIDLTVLTRPAVLLTNVVTLGLGYALFGSYYLVPYLVGGSGSVGPSVGPIGTGLYLLPATLGQVVAAPTAGLLAGRIAPKWVSGAGLAGLAGGCGVLAGLHAQTWGILLGTSLIGLGAGAALSVLSDLVTELVPQTESGAAASLNSTLRRFAGGIGGQVSAFLLATMTVAPHTPSSRAFAVAFAIAAGAAAAGAATSLAIRPDGSGD